MMHRYNEHSEWPANGLLNDFIKLLIMLIMLIMLYDYATGSKRHAASLAHEQPHSLQAQSGLDGPDRSTSVLLCSVVQTWSLWLSNQNACKTLSLTTFATG